MNTDKRYNIVVYGATGFTGQFVAEELYRLQKKEDRELKWAIAGRNRTSLENVLKALDLEGVEVLVADVNDQDSLERMCAETDVVIDCVGPYTLYGEPVVKACISQKSSYVDITGETYYMENIEAKYSELAKDAGVYVVSACGFDSIPNDLGALMVQRNFSGDLSYVDSYHIFHMASPGKNANINTGTWESVLRSIKSHGQLMKLRKEQNLPALILPTTRPPSRKPIFYNDQIGRWCVPFPGADKAVVHRSLRHRQENEGIHAFKFRPYIALDSLWQALILLPFFMFVLLLLMTDWGLEVLIKYHRFVTGGFIQTPKRETLEGLTFTTLLVGYGHSPGANKSGCTDSKVMVKVTGIDPGYGATSAMLVQSALAIVYERESLPSRGGVYTPGVVFGNTKIVENLTDTGKVQFEVLEN